MITRYGYDVLAVVAILALVGTLTSFYFIEWKPLKYTIAGVLILFLIFTINFFRDPERTTPKGDNLIISPADGKVVVIKELKSDEYVHGDAVQVSIFMSPLNVHVNRYPITGVVGHYQYHPGEYLVAYEDKSSLRNERTHIGVENDKTKVLFKQIAGFVARRIIAEVKVGDRAVAGERFGMIRFGSRVDMIMPKGVEIKVKLGEMTVAGETVIAVTS
ncbi:MAG: phosphatidylserine decarboxylase family protein [Bacteroidota bacterium]